MKMKLYIVLCLVPVAGCAENDGIVSVYRRIDYSIEQSRSCFCPQGGQSVKLFVAADTIADAIWLPNNNHLSYNERQRYRTIKGLYEEIERWDTSSTFRVDAEYDPVYHFPSSIHIYPRHVIINDTVVGAIFDADISYITWNYTKYGGWYFE
jgi:hypothetical protein